MTETFARLLEKITAEEDFLTIMEKTRDYAAQHFPGDSAGFLAELQTRWGESPAAILKIWLAHYGIQDGWLGAGLDRVTVEPY